MSNPSSLHILAKEGDSKTLAQALKTGDPNVADGDGMRPLHYAAWYGNVSCIQVLLAAGADINAFDHDGATALHAAAYNGQLATAVALVESKADATITDNDNSTAHQVAVEEGQDVVAKFLLVVEDNQKAEKVMQRLEKALAEAKERLKTTNSELSKASKEAKKTVASMEKAAKKIAKATLKNKRKSSKKSVIPEAGPVSSFSQLTGVPITTTAAPVGNNTSADQPTEESLPVSKAAMRKESIDTRRRMSQSTDGSADVASLGSLEEFMTRLDLKEFIRIFLDEGVDMTQLAQMSAGELKALGIPTGVRKKIMGALA